MKKREDFEFAMNTATKLLKDVFMPMVPAPGRRDCLTPEEQEELSCALDHLFEAQRLFAGGMPSKNKRRH